ncbi:hypothetical protein CPAV1605_814 [seawater metagenome]|uniref:Uncharacterized protein n=1 Tax=seawater metagenome TaxID=1561972 RepID=A0A5E8CKA1_9ZZZZ
MSTVVSKPYRISNIDIENIVYHSMKEGANKKILYLKYKDNNRDMPLTFQTPSLLNTEKTTQKTGFHELNVPLIGKNENKTGELIKFLRDLDQKFISDAKKFGSSWFGKAKNITYKSVIRSGNGDGKEYNNGVLRIKILDTDNFKTSLLLNNESPLHTSNIQSNHYVKMILECYALWITKEGFGLYLKPILMSFSPMKIDYNYSLLEDSDNDNNEEDNIVSDEILDTEIQQQHQETSSENETSQLDLPSNLNIINSEMQEMQEKNLSNVLSEVMNNKEDMQNSHLTSEYLNDDNNITTYQNYNTEDNSQPQNALATLNMNLEALDKSDTSETSDENVENNDNQNTQATYNSINILDTKYSIDSDSDSSPKLNLQKAFNM